MKYFYYSYSEMLMNKVFSRLTGLYRAPTCKTNPFIKRFFNDNFNSDVITSTMLSLKSANIIANAVVETAKRNNFAPITVTIVDSSGQVITMQRMDHCKAGAYPKYSYAKAFTAVNMNTSSRAFRDRYVSSDQTKVDFSKVCQMLSMVDIVGGDLAPFPGGVLLRSSTDNSVIGAIGVSGASGDEDEYCALEGVKALNFNIITEPINHSCQTIKKSA